MKEGRKPINKNRIVKLENGVVEMEIEMVNVKKGKYTVLFPEEILDEVKKWTWCINIGGYAIYTLSKSKGKGTIFLHHVVLPKKEGFIIDHINRNRLDNRKENLRYVTYSQNIHNSKKRCDNTTGIKGVHKQKDRNLWYGYININGKRIAKFFREKEDAINFRKKLEDKYI